MQAIKNNDNEKIFNDAKKLKRKSIQRNRNERIFKVAKHVQFWVYENGLSKWSCANPFGCRK